MSHSQGCNCTECGGTVDLDQISRDVSKELKSATRAWIDDASHYIRNTLHPSLTSGWFEEGLEPPVHVLALLLLNAQVWQAVGKQRGWDFLSDEWGVRMEPIRVMMHRFIDHLADGKSIDDALAAFSQGV